MSDEFERMATRRVPKTSLPIVGDKADDAAASSATPAVDDADADLSLMSDFDLRQLVDSLKVSLDQRVDRLLRRIKAIGLLRDRQGGVVPRTMRSDQGSSLAPLATQRAARRPRRVRFATILGRVNGGGGPKPVHDLAQWLADDLRDQDSIRTYRRIGDGIRSGHVDPRVVRAAYRAAKKPGVERPGALFTWYVLERAPGFARASTARVRHCRAPTDRLDVEP